MTICIDTNVYSALRRGHVQIRSVLESADVAIVPTVVLGELYAGFAAGSRQQANLSALERFLAKPGVQVFSVTTGVAARYGSIVHTLRRAGIPIPTNDIWIAAITLECGARLVTLDTHFDTIPTLIVDRYEPVE